MIIISSDLVLSPVEDEPLDHPLIGWHNIVTVSNIETDTEQADYPASNLANVASNLKWKGEVSVADEHITITTGTSDDIDYIAVVGHNWATAEIPVSVETLGNDSPTEWEELVGEAMLPDDGPALFRFTPQPLSEIRFRLQTGIAAPEASVVFVGKLLVMEMGVQGNFTPLPYARVANVVSGRSESGDFLGRIVTSSKVESGAEFIGLSPDWVREHLVPFLDVVDAQPFFFAWHPEDYPLEVGYAWAQNDPQPSLTIDGYVDFRIDMAGVVA